MTRASLTIGTRGSKLALTQTGLVRDALLAQHPSLTVDTTIITTKGDVALSLPLASVGDKGLFVTEIEEALRRGTIDLAVHSAKDLPAELPADMVIAAYLPRASALDVLVSRAGRLLDLPEAARIGTGSPRRAAQLKAVRPDLTVLDIRGNVDTRLAKLTRGEYDAIVLAASGLHRLGLDDVITEPLTPEVMLPAVGQGALAIETRAGDSEVAQLLAPLNDPATNDAVTAERAFLVAWGGGCSSVVAAYGVITGDALTLTGMIGDADGQLYRAQVSGSTRDALLLGYDLAMTLSEQAAMLAVVGEGAYDQ